MKILITWSMFFFAIFIYSGCKKDKKTEPIPTPKTSWFTATVGAFRDFEADLSKVTVDTINAQSKRSTQILAYDSENYSMILVFEGRDTGTYILGSSNYLGFLNPTMSLWRTYSNSGLLHITKYDMLNKKISGTFIGSMIKLEPPFDTLHVNDGEFVDITITE